LDPDEDVQKTPFSSVGSAGPEEEAHQLEGGVSVMEPLEGGQEEKSQQQHCLAVLL